MAWEADIKTSDFDVNAAFDSNKSGRGNRENTIGSSLGSMGRRAVSGILNRGSLGLFGSTDYDIVGINADKVEPVREAIRTYVRDIEKELEKFETEVDPKIAFRGEDAIAAVQAYLTKVKTYCINVSSDLLAFSDKLKDVENAWNAAQQSIGSGVEASNNGFSEGTHYTETIQ